MSIAIVVGQFERYRMYEASLLDDVFQADFNRRDTRSRKVVYLIAERWRRQWVFILSPVTVYRVSRRVRSTRLEITKIN